MKHNKKRNTAFLYECLVKELTKAIVRNDNDLKSKITEVIKENFKKGTILKKDLDIYNSLLEGTGQKEYSKALRVIYEIKRDYDNLDRKAVFNAQTKLIKQMNEALILESGITLFPNYKNMATADMFFKQKKLQQRSDCLSNKELLNSEETPLSSLK